MVTSEIDHAGPRLFIYRLRPYPSRIDRGSPGGFPSRTKTCLPSWQTSKATVKVRARSENQLGRGVEWPIAGWRTYEGLDSFEPWHDEIGSGRRLAKCRFYSSCCHDITGSNRFQFSQPKYLQPPRLVVRVTSIARRRPEYLDRDMEPMTTDTTILTARRTTTFLISFLVAIGSGTNYVCNLIRM